MTAAPAAETASPRWVQTLPLDVRLALAVCEDEGMGIDEYSTGSNEPVFYEVESTFLGCSTSLGSVVAMVLDDVGAACARYDIPAEHVSAIKSHIRTGAISGSYNEGLNWLMCWVGVQTDDED